MSETLFVRLKPSPLLTERLRYSTERDALLEAAENRTILQATERGPGYICLIVRCPSGCYITLEREHCELAGGLIRRDPKRKYYDDIPLRLPSDYSMPRSVVAYYGDGIMKRLRGAQNGEAVATTEEDKP